MRREGLLFPRKALQHGEELQLLTVNIIKALQLEPHDT